MDLLEKYKDDLEKIYTNKSVIAIIIFGSYVENNIKPLSDLDICIITKYNISKIQENKILSFSDEKLDLSLFHELPLSLQYKIMTKGKIFKSKKDLGKLKNFTMNQWMDFKPILNRIYVKKGLLPII
ncbi:MAG: nucleotidyltransferase domain-containing protein [Nanoarchaeota archaeon]|nr:nucleotidyltransferase domain-containing protein [Nanoarchaeota archaeon]